MVKMVGLIEMEIRRRLRESGGRTLPADGYTIIQKPEAIWDEMKLASLPELISPEEWAEIYTPASTKPVPPKINKAKINKALRDHGKNSDVGKFILAARHETVGKITVERKE